jgi:hypothetical protein
MIGASTASAQAPGIWSPAGSLIEGRFGHTATLLGNGNVLAAGGVARRENFLDAPPPLILASAELYNSGTDRWSSAGRMSTDREGHTATLLSTGAVLIVGGRNAGGDVLAKRGAVRSAQEYLVNP